MENFTLTFYTHVHKCSELVGRVATRHMYYTKTVNHQILHATLL